MSKYEEISQQNDEFLIKIITNSPNSPDAISAKEILEYRKYVVAKRQNIFIAFLTVVMAASAVIDVMLRLFGR